MLPPAPSVVVGAAVEKRFPGYGTYRGTIEEISGGKVVVHWAATDERTTLSLQEAAKRVIAIPSEGVDDDEQSVTSATFGIESSATSFTEHSGALHAAAPRHVLLELDDDGDLQTVDDDDDRSISSKALGISSSATSFSEDNARTTSSRFWGVSWNRKDKKWRAQYRDADGKMRSAGYFDDEEEAARARDQAIRDAGLQGKRRMNVVDATGALVPKRAAVIAPDPERTPTETTSKYWGVTWHKQRRRWMAQYTDANGKRRTIGYFDTQEDAARAYNATIRRAGLEGRRKTNPVVDGQLVPRAFKAAGHGPRYAGVKRRREEAAAARSPRARRR